MEVRQKYDAYFLLFLTIIFAVGVVLATTYGQTSRRFPLAISIPMVCLAVLLLLSQVSEFAEGITSTFQQSSLVDDIGDAGTEVDYSKIGQSVIAVVALAFSYYILGFLITTPAFIYLYLTRFGEIEPKPSLGAAIGVTVALLMFFEVLFSTSLYAGVVINVITDIIS